MSALATPTLSNILAYFIIGFKNIGDGITLIIIYITSLFGYVPPDWMVRGILLLSAIGLIWGLWKTIPKLLIFILVVVAICLIVGFVPSPQLQSLLGQVPV